jgi:hypothetical protein
MKQLLATPGLANSRMTTKLFVHLLNNIFPRGTVTYSNAATGQTQNVVHNAARTNSVLRKLALLLAAQTQRDTQASKTAI